MSPLRGGNLPSFFLKPGEMMVCKQPAVVSTLLGSCVSIVMYNRRHGIGAISHSLLPNNHAACEGCSDCCREAFRYVACSFRRMLTVFLRKGIVRSEIEVKVFGGSDMFGDVDEPASGRKGSVGKQNIHMALRMIEGENLRVLSSDVGGQRGRKLFFYPHTGEVLLKRLEEKLPERVGVDVP